MSGFELLVIEGAYESSHGLVKLIAVHDGSCRVIRSDTELTMAIEELHRLVSMPCPICGSRYVTQSDGLQIDLAEHMMRSHI